ncbi:hypothetical protein V2I01_28520 [Micromonospora sp. BRA006-A]|nr:hypothetical protein [Micromonospora sp. BRA006-A]
MALTATASPPVRDDIIARLRLREPEVVVSRAGPAQPLPGGATARPTTTGGGG